MYLAAAITHPTLQQDYLVRESVKYSNQITDNIQNRLPTISICTISYPDYTLGKNESSMMTP